MSVIDSLTTVQAAAPQGTAAKGDQKSGVDFAAMLQQVPDQPEAAAGEKPGKSAPVAEAGTAESAPEGEVASAVKTPRDKKATAKAEPEKKARKAEADPDAAPGAVAALAASAVAGDAQAPVEGTTPQSPDIAAVGAKVGKMAPSAADGPMPEPVDSGKPLPEAAMPVKGQAEVKDGSPAPAIAAPGKALGHERGSVPSEGDAPKDAKPAPANPVSPANVEKRPDAPVNAADKPVQPGEATALLRLAAAAPVASAAIGAAVRTPGKAAVEGERNPDAAEDLPTTPNAAAAQAGAAPKANGKAVAEAATTTPAPLPAAAAIATPAKSDSHDDGRSKDEPAQAMPSPVRATSDAPAVFGLRSDIIVSAPLTGTTGVGDIGSALTQQSIAIGTSGQWIDDIAREIASVSGSNGHGSFQLASNTLGQMRVDLTQGASGTDIRLTVDNEAAEAALMADRGRLVQDAQLASIRIGEVRIDRVAPLGDAQAMGNGSQGQSGNGGGQSSTQSGLQQNAGQSHGQSARQNAEAAFGQSGGGNGGQPKPASVRAVSNDSARGDGSARADQMDGPQARYA